VLVACGAPQIPISLKNQNLLRNQTIITNFAVTMDDEKFRQELDELFKLFNRLMAQSDTASIPGVNSFMLQQFQMFFTNYETMKDDIARQLQGQFGDSVKDMVHQLVIQLRNEVGEEEPYQVDTSVDVHITPVKEESSEAQHSLQELDEMLKNPNLTEEEIDELLDKRSKLKGYH